jgi:CRP-like cAMP-binding protein
MRIDDLGKDIVDGEVIFREGDPGDCMFIILKGKVKITKETPHGELYITTLEEGEIFGEMSLFDGQPRSATATSNGPSRIMTLDRKMFFSNISRDPTIAFKILQSMTERVRRLIDAYSRMKMQKFDIMKHVLDLEEVCRSILVEARDAVDTDNGSIMLLDEDGDTLRITSAFGQESKEKTILKTGDGIAGKVLESGEAQMVNDAASSPMFKSGELKINSLVCVPLSSDAGRLGVLNLSTSTDKKFNMQDLNSVKLLATYSTMALRSAMQCGEMRKATEVLTNVLEELAE